MGNIEEAPAGSPGVVGRYDGQRDLDGHHGDKEPQGVLLQLHDQGARHGVCDDQGDAQRRNR
eukprot:1882093-Heterocapsa_arctica.AAC.1